MAYWRSLKSGRSGLALLLHHAQSLARRRLWEVWPQLWTHWRIYINIWGHQLTVYHSRKSSGPFSETPQSTPFPTDLLLAGLGESSSMDLSFWRETWKMVSGMNYRNWSGGHDWYSFSPFSTTYSKFFSPSVTNLAGLGGLCGGVVQTSISVETELLVTTSFWGQSCCMCSQLQWGKGASGDAQVDHMESVKSSDTFYWSGSVLPVMMVTSLFIYWSLE